MCMLRCEVNLSSATMFLSFLPPPPLTRCPPSLVHKYTGKTGTVMMERAASLLVGVARKLFHDITEIISGRST